MAAIESLCNLPVDCLALAWKHLLTFEPIIPEMDSDMDVEWRNYYHEVAPLLELRRTCKSMNDGFLAAHGWRLFAHGLCRELVIKHAVIVAMHVPLRSTIVRMAQPHAADKKYMIVGSALASANTQVGVCTFDSLLEARHYKFTLLQKQHDLALRCIQIKTKLLPAANEKANEVHGTAPVVRVFSDVPVRIFSGSYTVRSNV